MPLPPTRLSDADRAVLRGWAAQEMGALAIRARIVLACAGGLEPAMIAASLGINVQTVGKWRARFLDSGLAGLRDRPRAGAPSRLPKEVVDRVTTLLNCDGVHRSSRAIARAARVSASTVLRMRRAVRT